MFLGVCWWLDCMGLKFNMRTGVVICSHTPCLFMPPAFAALYALSPHPLRVSMPLASFYDLFSCLILCPLPLPLFVLPPLVSFYTPHNQPLFLTSPLTLSITPPYALIIPHSLHLLDIYLNLYREISVASS